MKNIISSMESFKKYSFELHGKKFEAMKLGSDVVVEINKLAGMKNIRDFETTLQAEILVAIENLI